MKFLSAPMDSRGRGSLQPSHTTTFTKTPRKAPQSQTKHQLILELHLWHYQQQAWPPWLQLCKHPTQLQCWGSCSLPPCPVCCRVKGIVRDENCPGYHSFYWSRHIATLLFSQTFTWLTWEKLCLILRYKTAHGVRVTAGLYSFCKTQSRRGKASRIPCNAQFRINILPVFSQQ